MREDSETFRKDTQWVLVIWIRMGIRISMWSWEGVLKVICIRIFFLKTLLAIKITGLLSGLKECILTGLHSEPGLKLKSLKMERNVQSMKSFQQAQALEGIVCSLKSDLARQRKLKK